MSTCQLCFGPYNDPSGRTGNRCCNLPHDAICRNPAFNVRSDGMGGYVARVAVRNMSALTSPSDITVAFYACDLPIPLTRPKVASAAAKVLAGMIPNLIVGQTTFAIDPGSIPAFSSASDSPWIVGPVSATPTQSGGVVFVAALTCPTWDLSHVTSVLPTQDPCVAVWVGP